MLTDLRQELICYFDIYYENRVYWLFSLSIFQLKTIGCLLSLSFLYKLRDLAFIAREAEF